MTDSTERILADLRASELMVPDLDRLVKWLFSGYPSLDDDAFFANNNFSLEDLRSATSVAAEQIGTVLSNEIFSMIAEAKKTLGWHIPTSDFLEEVDVEWAELYEKDINAMDRDTAIDHLKKAKKEITYLGYCLSITRHRMNERLRYRPEHAWDISKEYSPPLRRSYFEIPQRDAPR